MGITSNFRKNHSILFCILFAAVYMLFFNLIGKGVHHIMKNDSMLMMAVVELICIGFAVLIIYILGIRNFLKEKGAGFFKGLFTGMFILCLSLYTFAMGLIESVFSNKIGLSDILQILIMSIAVGLCEEIVFRGLIINILKEKYGDSKKGIYITVFTSGIIFGLIHLNNILAGASVQGSIVQAICVIPIGSYLAAVYVRCRNIWSLAFLHALNDFSIYLLERAATIQSVTGFISAYEYIEILSILIYLVPTFILLRNSKMNEIIEK